MTDLYQILGIDRDADHGTIRRAFRQKSKTMHPDVGGDLLAFKALNQAHDVLTDPARRAHYDKTGQIIDGTDNSRSYVLEAIDCAFNAVAMKLAEQKCRDMNVIDMLQQMKLYLSAEESRLKQLTAEFAREIGMLDELVGRFAVTDAGENFVQGMLRAKIALLTEKSENPKLELTATTAAIEELKRYTFERRFVPPPMTPTVPRQQVQGFGGPYSNPLFGGPSW